MIHCVSLIHYKSLILLDANQADIRRNNEMILDDLIVKRECIIYSPSQDKVVDTLKVVKECIIWFMRDKGYTSYQGSIFEPLITPLIFDNQLANVTPPLKDTVKKYLRLLTEDEYKIIKYDLALQRIDKRHPINMEVSFNPFSRKAYGIKVTFVAKPVIYILINKGIKPANTIKSEELDFVLNSCNELVSDLIKNINGKEIHTEPILTKQNSYIGLIKKGESQLVEFKSSLWWDYNQNKQNKDLQNEVMKTIAAFLNSNGGYLFIGVQDNGEILGLEPDFKLMSKTNRDGFLQALTNIINNYLGKIDYSNISCQCEEIEGKDICIVRVQKSKKPIVVKYKQKDEFFIRTNSGSQKLDLKDSLEYTHRNFKR